MRNPRSSPANLCRRLEALEKSWSLTEQAGEAMILSILNHMSQDELESLIDARLAQLRGRELTEREIAGKQAYAAVQESERRWRRLTVTRTPDLPELIHHTAIRDWNYEDLTLLTTGMRAVCQGFEPTPEQLAAVESSFAAKQAEYQGGGFSFHRSPEPMVDELVAILLFHSALDVQYRRAGFSSEEELQEWYGKQTKGKSRGPWS